MFSLRRKHSVADGEVQLGGNYAEDIKSSIVLLHPFIS